MKKPKCRFCGNELRHTFVDLGMSPLANSYVSPAAEGTGEMTYPLRVRVCDECFLVQMDEFESPEGLFSDYAYFSSYSTSWLEHSKKYVDYMTENYGINEHSQVIEIASNDGYLLQYFKERGIPVLGIEPAENVAKVAREERGIPTLTEFFGTDLATRVLGGDSCRPLACA